MSEKSVHVRIEGRVQGVWFRAWTQQEAKEHKLDGWVRNRRDGSVEALFSGGIENVDAMVKKCWCGPPASQVNNVEISPAEKPDESGFFGLATR